MTTKLCFFQYSVFTRCTQFEASSVFFNFTTMLWRPLICTLYTGQNIVSRFLTKIINSKILSTSLGAKTHVQKIWVWRRVEFNIIEKIPERTNNYFEAQMHLYIFSQYRASNTRIAIYLCTNQKNSVRSESGIVTPYQYCHPGPLQNNKNL